MDLVNWEFAGHSVPMLDFGSKYYLNGGRGYVRGIWASSLGYRPSNGLFYWIGQIDFADTYVYTAPAARLAVEAPSDVDADRAVRSRAKRCQRTE